MFLQWDESQQCWVSQQQWSGNDRALNYGDGLFETLRFNAQGQIPLWQYHQTRLAEGLAALSFPSESLTTILNALDALPQTARCSAGKLLISRGKSDRGYAYPECSELALLWHNFSAPTWAVERFPQGYLVKVSPVKLSRQPQLAGIKHLNRLEQVLARNQFTTEQQEAVLCDTEEQVIEGCMSNLFVVVGQRLITPRLSHSGVNGVVRRWLQHHYSVEEARLSVTALLEADALFFCNSLNGIIPVARLEQQVFSSHTASWKYIQQLQKHLESEFC